MARPNVWTAEMTHEGLLPQASGMLDPRPYEPEARVKLLDRAYREVMADNGGTYWVSGGPEETLLWQATLDSFAEGIWVATVVCAQATCERSLASLLDTWYSIRPGPKGWERRGLGFYISHLREVDLVHPALLDQVQYVCEARKPFGHWKAPMDPVSLERLGYDAHLRGEDWTEAQDQYVAQLAFVCVRTALRVYFGDLTRHLRAFPKPWQEEPR